MGDVIGDLNSRRGKILGMSQRGERAGHRLRGAARDDVRLRDGPAQQDAGPRTSYTMQFSHYEPVPRAVQEEIVAKVKGTRSTG